MTTNPTPFDTSDAAEHAGAPASSPGVDPGQPVAAVREAYWYGTRLIHHGWIIRRVGATGRGGFFVAETPRGRAVTVGTDHRCAVSDDLAAQFADSITVLAAAGSEDNHDYLRDLVLLLGAHTLARRPARLQWRTWRIPGVPGCQQPAARVRAAYWFAATLTDDYGWELSEIGSVTARGGFVADIPGEAMAIYPADMPDDHTTAAALARLLAAMDHAEIRTLASLVGWHSAARALGGTHRNERR